MDDWRQRRPQLWICHPRRIHPSHQQARRVWLAAQAKHVRVLAYLPPGREYLTYNSSVLGSWDAEEYGLIGSVEWVEDHADWLTETAVAYLNIDVAVSGPRVGLATTPELHKISTETFKKVVSPNLGSYNESLYEAWQRDSGGEVGVLGSGSDYTPFLHYGINAVSIACEESLMMGLLTRCSLISPPEMVPTILSGTTTPTTTPIVRAILILSLFDMPTDTWKDWMATYGDPGFLQHAAIGQYLALLAYHLASDEVLPIDVETYGVELGAYRDDLVEFIEPYGVDIDLSVLSDAIEVFVDAAAKLKKFEEVAIALQSQESIAVVNHKYSQFQRGFISQGGLPDREFYRHAVTAPGLDTGKCPSSV